MLYDSSFPVSCGRACVPVCVCVRECSFVFGSDVEK